MRRLDKKVRGTKQRPRLIVTKSLNNLYAQIIDDEKQNTIIGISSKSLKLGRANKDVATKLGEQIADQAKKKKIKKVVFDRGKCIYHGRIKMVAEGARSKGLEF